MKPVYVYVAGPLSRPNPALNVRAAVFRAERLHQLGYTPYVPHLTHFWEMITGGKSWDEWLEFDERWLLKCDVVYRMPGDSPGADREVAFAREHGIPVVYSVEELDRCFLLKSSERRCIHCGQARSQVFSDAREAKC